MKATIPDTHGSKMGIEDIKMVEALYSDSGVAIVTQRQQFNWKAHLDLVQ
jgi:hypothetical protein